MANVISNCLIVTSTGVVFIRKYKRVTKKSVTTSKLKMIRSLFGDYNEQAKTD